MTNDQKSLWNLIEQFPLDEPGVAFAFSQRLAHENRWSHAHAERAIREYKRFIFLGCVAGHPVSPSEDVDQVWHLHLAYTKSYWQEFCGEILRRPFHHSPTKGGETESAKFENWYANTLASYRKFFDEQPPADIWPARPVHHELKWIDTGSNWIVPKPRVASILALIGALGLLTVAGCASLGDINVFDYRGPEFLAFFALFSVIVFIAAALWRRAMTQNLRAGAVQGDQLDPYSMAYLAGGPILATNAAILGLLDRKLVSFAPGSAELQRTAATNSVLDLHPIERVILDQCAASLTSVRQARDVATAELRKVRADLEQRGLVVERSQSERIRNLSLAVVLLIPVIALIKIVVGISRDKPVIFLVFGLFISIVVIVVGFHRRPFRTPVADEILAKRRAEWGGVRTPPASGVASNTTLFPMAVALFGLAALEQTPYASMRSSLTPKRNNSFGDSVGASCGTSCGVSCSGGGSSCGGATSSSCSGGGSSCGGGGGGSGCGGCSGGGGH
jgi:uncharacterized protein (TIGR04222 family)